MQQRREGRKDHDASRGVQNGAVEGATVPIRNGKQNKKENGNEEAQLPQRLEFPSCPLLYAIVQIANFSDSRRRSGAVEILKAILASGKRVDPNEHDPKDPVPTMV